LPALLGVAGLAAVLVVGGGIVSNASSSQLPATRPVLGSPDAAIVIREYGDFQCPSCGAFARQIEPQIRAAYIDTGIARLEWHDFAWIGRESRDAANAARCAGDQEKFWEYHDVLYRSQAGENQGAFSKERLKDFGERLDLEPAAFVACIDGDGHADAIARDMADVRDRGLNATPTFLVGDQRIVGAQPFEVFQAAIEAQLGGG
jgi:protein-disulfide isomerase